MEVSTEPCLDYSFAFNNAKFSDRTLQLQIMSPVTRKRKTLFSNAKSSKNAATLVKAIHISTPILAAKSQFFFKLFSNGMSESDDQHVTLRIQESEEAAFMDLLKFIYTNTLSSTTPSAIIDVLIAADKYEVTSCMKYCSLLLPKSSMTCESAFLYLNLPSTILLEDAVRPLTDIAKKFLVERFQNKRVQEEMLNLSLPVVEAILSSDDLYVDSEDEIYDFVLKWARKHYPKLPKRREILNSRLLPLIRFQYMSCKKLKEVQECTDITLKRSSELVFDALSLQIPHRQLSLVSHEKERAYKRRPVKVTRFRSPREECIVYLDLKREDCQCSCPLDRIKTQSFDLSGQQFYLDIGAPSSDRSFGVFLHRLGNRSLGVEYDFSSRRKPSEEFVSVHRGNREFDKPTGWGRKNLFGVPWETFIAEDSPYFINGVLHLRATITIKKDV